MNLKYVYKEDAYTLVKISETLIQYKDKWYPTVKYKNEKHTYFRSAKEFFEKFEPFKEKTKEELEKDFIEALKGFGNGPIVNLSCEHEVEVVKEIKKLEETKAFYSLQEIIDYVNNLIATGMSKNETKDVILVSDMDIDHISQELELYFKNYISGSYRVHDDNMFSLTAKLVTIRVGLQSESKSNHQ